MILERLSLRDYRNYTALDAAFSSGANILVGQNAQGKTNLLEAVYLLATTKSLRGSRDQEVIAWEKERAMVTGEVRRTRRADVELEAIISRAEKKLLRVNGVRQTRVMDFVGQLNAVAFSTSDIEVIRGEPALRRRFLDLEISQISPSYCHSLAYYRRTLEQRNQLLKQARDRRHHGPVEESLAPWNDQLISYGSRIIERRAQFLRRLQEFARTVHSALTEETEYLGLTYKPSVPIEGEPSLEEIRMTFTEALDEVRAEERARGVSVVGPHRDDLACLVNGYDVRTYGSQGQQRTAALSIKLAEIELIRDLTEEPPVCLLDDVMSELDERRRSHIFDVTMGTCQTLLTCTDTATLPAEILRQAEVLEVRAGAVRIARSS
jgi:DNA replication and repair protein RecF